MDISSKMTTTKNAAFVFLNLIEEQHQGSDPFLLYFWTN